jgi:hypothetical protein
MDKKVLNKIFTFLAITMLAAAITFTVFVFANM